MLNSNEGKIKICNWLCAAATLCLVILQFTPFWNCNGRNVSICGYVWLNPQDTELASWFSSQLGSILNVNSVVITSVLVLILGVAGIYLCLWKSGSGFVSIVSALSGISGIYGFALKPVFRLGSTWIVQLILCIVIVALAIYCIVSAKSDKNKAKKENAVNS